MVFMRSYVLGFVLRINDFRESDKIINIYTDKFGKIEVLVRGGKRLTSKLAGKCQPFVLLELFLSSGRFFWHLIGLEIRQLFKNIWRDKNKIEIGTKIILATDSYLQPGKADIKIFKLIFNALVVLNFISSDKSRLVLVSFLIKLADLLGYQPNFKGCIICQKKDLSELKFFHFEKGGLICRTCQAKFKGETISPETVSLLSQMKNKKFAFWLKAALPEEKVLEETEKTIDQFIKWHLR